MCAVCEQSAAIFGTEPPPAKVESVRSRVLDDAKRLITGDRNNTYGPPTQDFSRTAAMLNALGFGHHQESRDILPHDVAIIMACVKLSRLTWSPEKRDTWIDLAGYAGCGFECVATEMEEQDAEGSACDYQ